jgi:hypothetical protein
VTGRAGTHRYATVDLTDPALAARWRFCTWPLDAASPWLVTPTWIRGSGTSGISGTTIAACVGSNLSVSGIPALTEIAVANEVNVGLCGVAVLAGIESACVLLCCPVRSAAG